MAEQPAPTALVEGVIQAGPLLQAGTVTGLSTSAMILAKGVMWTMFLRKIEMTALIVVALSLIASGASWLTSRSGGPAVQAASAQPSAATRAATKAATSTAETSDEINPTSSESELVSDMARVVAFSGVDDPRTTLPEVLDHLSKSHRLSFDINEKAFKQENLTEVSKTYIADNKPLPPMKASLRMVLNKLLSRLPVETAYLIRQDHIEITTLQAARSEVGITNEKPFILAHADFKKLSLDEALTSLSRSTGANIVVDVRVEEKANVKVTARLMNVQIDTAVKLLANMAGLAVVRIGNVLYVTSPENARKLEMEQAAGQPTP
jgi:hypothetical protein